MDVTQICFADDSFDAILCIHVLEHVQQDRQALHELHRVLKPGGWGLLDVPMDDTRQATLEDPRITSPLDRERHFGQHDHVRAYGLDYYDRVAQAGFRVRRDRFAAELDPARVARHGIEIRDICLVTKAA
jgi:ubiquinone/menaquinone biosynthesis C-methylase UbiE